MPSGGVDVDNVKDWMSYLDVAARLYRYSFTDTLLIHAQRPDATACAELELWNQNKKSGFACPEKETKQTCDKGS